MKEKIKKIIKPIFWGLFLAWNMVLLFIITGKEEKPREKQAITPPRIEQKINHSYYENEFVKYQFNDIGGEISKIELKKYKKDVNNNENVNLLEKGTIDIKFNNELTNEKWQIEQDKNNVILKAEKNGITFLKKYTFDENYGIKLEGKIINNTKNSAIFQPKIILRKKANEQKQSFIFSGITTYVSKKLNNYKLEKIKNQESKESGETYNWAAYNEKYWLILCANKSFFETVNLKQLKNAKRTISISSDNFKVEENKIKISETSFDIGEKESKELEEFQEKYGENEKHEISLSSDKFEVAGNKEQILEAAFYVGPKELKQLKNFEEKYQINHIQDTFDYGWLFLLTKPVHYVLKYFIENIGVVFAIILLTILLKLATWPLATRSQISAKKVKEKMSILTPEINKIKEKYPNDKTKADQEIFLLYRAHKINPTSGIFMGIIQMLLLFPLYKVLNFSIELYHVPFFGWIKDLSAPDNYYIFNLFGLLPFQVPSFLMVGIWPILMGLTMFAQQKLTSFSQKPDKIMEYGLPVLFTWLMSSISSGVIIYWTLTNVLTILQMLYINKKENF